MVELVNQELDARQIPRAGAPDKRGNPQEANISEKVKRLQTFEANERNNHSKSFKPLAADASVFYHKLQEQQKKK